MEVHKMAQVKEAQEVMEVHLKKKRSLCLHKVGQLQEVTVPIDSLQIQLSLQEILHFSHLLVQDLLLSKGDRE